MLGYVLWDWGCSVLPLFLVIFIWIFSGYGPFEVQLSYRAVTNRSLKMLVGFYSLLMGWWLSGEVVEDFFWKGSPSRWALSSPLWSRQRDSQL